MRARRRCSMHQRILNRSRANGSARAAYGLCIHSFEIAHLPRALTSSLLNASLDLMQSKAHSRPSSPQSRKQRVVCRQTMSLAHILSSHLQLETRQPSTRRSPARTSLFSRIAPHQPSLQGFHQPWCFSCCFCGLSHFCFLPASTPSGVNKAMTAKTRTKRCENLLEVRVIMFDASSGFYLAARACE